MISHHRIQLPLTPGQSLVFVLSLVVLLRTLPLSPVPWRSPRLLALILTSWTYSMMVSRLLSMAQRGYCTFNWMRDNSESYEPRCANNSRNVTCDGYKMRSSGATSQVLLLMALLCRSLLT